MLLNRRWSSSKRLLRFISNSLPTRLSFKKDFSSDTEKNVYDVTIVGGGMVGGAMACALGSSRYMKEKKILLLEGGQGAPTDILLNPPEFHSNRVCAISPGNVQLLDSLNIWNKIPRSCSVKKMQVWDSSSDAVISFDRNNMSEDLCRITENSLIVAAITEVLQSQLKDSISIKFNTKIKSCHFPPPYVPESNKLSDRHVVVTTEDGQSLLTKLLIAADGANSAVVKQSGIKLLKWNYDQSAVVATLRLSESAPNFVAWQRFLPTGPIALLPLNDEFSSLVWSTSHEQAAQLVEMEEEDLISQINSAFWDNYPQSELVGQAKEFLESLLRDNAAVMQYPPSVTGLVGKAQKFPLGFSHANLYVKQGLAVIGDACHRIHPLAGQGVNLGLRDVACLTQILNEAVYNGEELGSLSSLRSYESERQLANFPIATAVDMLKRLYSTDNTATVALRTFGLMFTNAMEPLKEFLIEEAIK